MTDRETRELVRRRADDTCEYCRICQADEPFLRYHLEHVIAKQHGGSDDVGNLALSCHHCNLHKGPNLTAIDPISGEIVRLFDPRTQQWHDHFRVEGAVVVGISPCGRATVRLLRMNATARMELRAIARLSWPPR